MKAILYELQPISSLPTRQDIFQAFAEARVTAIALYGLLHDAYRAIAPHVLPGLRRIGWKGATSFIAWCLAYYLFVKVEFGTVYMILSAMAIITTIGLGDTRRAGEMSAWSVFNTGFQSLLGTLQAEQFENEIMHRMDNLRGGHVVEDRGEEHHGPVDDRRQGEQEEVEGHNEAGVGSRKSGKKARRRFDREERRRKREAAALRQAAEGAENDEWDSD